MTRLDAESSSNVFHVLIVLAERNVKVIASAVQVTMSVGPRADDPQNLTSTRLAMEIFSALRAVIPSPFLLTMSVILVISCSGAHVRPTLVVVSDMYKWLITKGNSHILDRFLVSI